MGSDRKDAIHGVRKLEKLRKMDFTNCRVSNWRVSYVCWKRKVALTAKAENNGNITLIGLDEIFHIGH